MKLAVLGVGRIGLMHARFAAQCPQVEEVVLYDVDPARAGAAASELSATAGGPARVTGSSDLGAVLGWADGALVATPTPVHEESVLAALGAGVPVLCEKPLATDRATVVRLADAAGRAGVPLVVGFQRRFDPEVRALRDGVAAGRFGTVYLLRAVAADHRPPPVEFLAGSGGIFLDLLVHDLDALPWVLGERAVRVSATGSVLVDERIGHLGDVDTAAVVLTFASGALGVLTTGRSNGSGYDNRIELSGELECAASGLGPRTPLTALADPDLLPGPAWDGFAQRWETAYRREVATFADVVAGRADNPSPALDGLHALELAEACATSLREGRPVDVVQTPVPSPAPLTTA